MKAHIYKDPALVLVWNYAESQPGYESLRAICRRYKAKLHTVTPEEAGETVAALLGLEPLHHAQSGHSTEQAAILFSGLDRHIQGILDALRAAEVEIPLKALATPTNRGWSFAALLDELEKEHKAMAAEREEKA